MLWEYSSDAFPRSEIIIGKDVIMVSSSQRCIAGSIYAPVKLGTLSSTARIIIEDNVGLILSANANEISNLAKEGHISLFFFSDVS